MPIKAKPGTELSKNSPVIEPPPPVEPSEETSVTISEAPLPAITTQGLEQAERAIAKIYTMPQVRTVRITYSLQMTIPTGDYQNIIPKMEVEMEVEEGAIAPAHEEILADLRADVCKFMRPMVWAQVKSTEVNKPNDGKTTFKQAAVNTLMVKSSLFKWLSIVERDMAAEVLDQKIAQMQGVN